MHASNLNKLKNQNELKKRTEKTRAGTVKADKQRLRIAINFRYYHLVSVQAQKKTKIKNRNKNNKNIYRNKIVQMI